jgi:hypothetical protein
MALYVGSPQYPFNADPATAFGAFSRLDKLIEDAVNEAGEKNAAVLIAKYQNHLVNAANKVVDDVNRHPYFLQLLEPGCQFDDGIASVVADSTDIQILSGFSGIGSYVPLVLWAVGYGTPPGPIYTFTLSGWTNGQSKLRIADSPVVTKADTLITPVARGRKPLYSVMTDNRGIGDRVVIEGIKYYWALDREITTRPQNVQKCRAQYYTELNSWLGQLRNVHGILEIDHDQRGADY